MPGIARLRLWEKIDHEDPQWKRCRDTACLKELTHGNSVIKELSRLLIAS